MKFKDLVKEWLNVIDLKSGVIMSVWTLTIIALSVVSVLKKLDIPATVVTLYGMGLGAFAVHKTTTALNTKVEESK